MRSPKHNMWNAALAKRTGKHMLKGFKRKLTSSNFTMEKYIQNQEFQMHLYLYSTHVLTGSNIDIDLVQ